MQVAGMGEVSKEGASGTHGRQQAGESKRSVGGRGRVERQREGIKKGASGCLLRKLKCSIKQDECNAHHGATCQHPAQLRGPSPQPATGRAVLLLPAPPPALGPPGKKRRPKSPWNRIEYDFQ